MSNLLTCCQRHPEKTARIDLFVTSSSCFLVNTVYSWTHSRTELRPSTKHPGCYDQPVEATAWLKNFRAANTQFLSKVINLFTFTHIPTRKQQKAGRGEHLGSCCFLVVPIAQAEGGPPLDQEGHVTSQTGFEQSH